MRRIRAGLHGNFLSLDRAVRAVAACLEISGDEVEERRGLNRSDDEDVQTRLDRSVIRRVLSEAKAAGILLRHLNQPARFRPSWRDASIGGFPILDEGVSREGLEMLARWALVEASFELHRSHWAGQGEPDLCMGQLPGASRLVHIGFDIDDFIHFLDSIGVGHNLGKAMNAPSAPAAVEPGQVSTIAQGAPQAGATDTTIAQPSALGSNQSPGGDASQQIASVASKPLPTFNFRGPLSEVLHLAVKNAADPRRYTAAYEALRELARAKDPPIPLLGYSAAGDEVLWNNGDRDSPASFTKENMKSRYRSMKDSS